MMQDNTDDLCLAAVRQIKLFAKNNPDRQTCQQLLSYFEDYPLTTENSAAVLRYSQQIFSRVKGRFSFFGRSIHQEVFYYIASEFNPDDVMTHALLFWHKISRVITDTHTVREALNIVRCFMRKMQGFLETGGDGLYIPSLVLSGQLLVKKLSPDSTHENSAQDNWFFQCYIKGVFGKVNSEEANAVFSALYQSTLFTDAPTNDPASFCAIPTEDVCTFSEDSQTTELSLGNSLIFK